MLAGKSCLPQIGRPEIPSRTLMESAALSPAVSHRILRSPCSAAIVASYLKTVFLHDWWLIKVDADSRGRQLGVGGYAARKGQAIRTFHSAAIVKRHDAVTLETADGIKVTITGFINRSRTLEKGFTLEVCSHFLFGFPDYWENYTGVHSSEESHSGSAPPGVSWNDLPVTRVRDILMSSREDSGNCPLAETILSDILHEYGGVAYSSPPTCTQIHDMIPQKEMRTELGEKSKDNHANLCSADTEKAGLDKTVPESEMAVDVNTYKRITRSQTVRKDKEEVAEGEITSPDVDSSRRVCKSTARKLCESAPPIRRSKRLRKLPK